MSVEGDTTERRVLEARLTHLEKMESIGRLAGGIAHDFNNLLTAILGFTEVLLTNRPADHPDRPPLEEIQKAGLRAASLTQQLLAFSRKQVLLAREVDLNQTVLGLRSMLVLWNLLARFRADRDPRRLHGDRLRRHRDADAGRRLRPWFVGMGLRAATGRE